jgi:hypothetical protein
MDHYGGLEIALTITLHVGLLMAIKNIPVWRAPNFPYYSLARRPLLRHIMDRYRGPQTALTIAWQGGLYLAIIMDRYRLLHTPLTIALYGGLQLAIKMDRYRWPQTALTIALRGVF